MNTSIGDIDVRTDAGLGHLIFGRGPLYWVKPADRIEPPTKEEI